MMDQLRYRLDAVPQQPVRRTQEGIHRHRHEHRQLVPAQPPGPVAQALPHEGHEGPDPVHAVVVSLQVQEGRGGGQARGHHEAPNVHELSLGHFVGGYVCKDIYVCIIYIYIYSCVCACVYMCVCMCVRVYA